MAGATPIISVWYGRYLRGMRNNRRLWQWKKTCGR